MNTTAVEEIKACEGVYRAADVARAYDIHRSTVTRIWDGRIHSSVSAAPEIPNIQTKSRPQELAEDIRMLAGRGMAVETIANELGISLRSVYLYRGVFV